MKNKTISNKNGPGFLVNEKVSLEEQIAHRAHELWEQRNHGLGDDLTDWLRAEQEINEWHHSRLKKD
jgi:hypothetical protein